MEEALALSQQTQEALALAQQKRRSAKDSRNEYRMVWLGSFLGRALTYVTHYQALEEANSRIEELKTELGNTKVRHVKGTRLHQADY